MKSLQVIRRILSFVKPLRHYFPEYLIYTFLGIIFGVVNFAMLIPVLNILFGLQKAEIIHQLPSFSLSIDYFTHLFQYYFQKIMESDGKMAALIYVCSLIVVFSILSNVFRYLAVKTLIRLRFKVMENIRYAIYSKFCRLPLRFFVNHKKGELVSIVTTEVYEIENSLINALQVLLRDPFVIIVYFATLFYMSDSLTFFTLLFFPVSGIAISYISKKLKKIGYFNQKMASRVLSFTDETLSGIKIIKSFTAENFMKWRFSVINQMFSKSGKAMFSKRELASPFSEIMGVMVVVALVLYGGSIVISQSSELTGSMFITYLVLYTQLIQPFKNLSNTSTQIQRGVIAAEKIFGLLDEDEPISYDRKELKLNEFNQRIEFRNVSFRYGEELVLKDINLTIEKGKRVALVGESGAGKSTLADLLARFYDVSDGGIFIDGVNIRDFELESLRRQIGIVSQDAMLFNDSIFSNIAFGQKVISDDDVFNAAKIADAHSFIEDLERRYATNVGDRGVKLSGGQRQRITIARAIFKNPPILIFDEATSALDTESEQQVQAAVTRLMKERTSIVIAHRLSTIVDADEICVMQKGRIVERGTHDDLLKLNGYYKKLVDMQTF